MTGINHWHLIVNRSFQAAVAVDGGVAFQQKSTAESGSSVSHNHGYTLVRRSCYAQRDSIRPEPTIFYRGSCIFLIGPVAMMDTARVAWVLLRGCLP